jgi:hypothetical protein
MNTQQKEYSITAFHVVDEKNNHPRHVFYANNVQEAEKIADKMIAELYNTDEADVEFWPHCIDEVSDYLELNYTEEQKKFLVSQNLHYKFYR